MLRCGKSHGELGSSHISQKRICAACPFNLRGEVVGVTNMKITFGEGLGFAIPVEQVKFFLTHRDAYAYDADNPSNAYRYLRHQVEQPNRRRG